MEKERVLFAGNGFNSLDRNYVSWTELIKLLFKKFGVYDTYIRLFVDKVSPYMQYELLAQAIVDKKGKFDEADDKKIREEIASITSRSLEWNTVHKAAVNTYDQIITLNYDSCFEAAMTDGCRNKKVWHAHGLVTEDGNVDSLCMWFQTYIQNVAEIKIHLAQAIEEMIPELEAKDNYSGEIKDWFQLFFTSDVDIIGTELSYSELDVWWVLTNRARLIREGKLRKDFNHIRYFMLKPYKNEKMSEEKISKIALLKSLYIEIEFVTPEDYFKDNKIFVVPESDVTLSEISPAPSRAVLYNTEWYYLKALGL